MSASLARTLSDEWRGRSVAIPAVCSWALEQHERAERAERFRAEYAKFTAAIGFGDGITEPMAEPRDLIDPVQEAFSVAADHNECPVWCDSCGQWERPRSCAECHGSGCSPLTALGAYAECEQCGGDGTDHERYSIGTDYPLEELIERAERLEAENAELRAKVAAAARGAWDEGYSACLRQWNHPANADRMPERNPYPAALRAKP